MEKWNRSVLKIRRHQHREPNLKDITEFVEYETILMNDPLFSCEGLGEFTKPEWHSRQQKTNSYVVKSKDGTDEKGVRTQTEKKLKNCQLCNRYYDLDECKVFNDMVVAARSKFLAKQKLCYGCYESISAKQTTQYCPKRRTCKICLEKHPTGLQG